SIPTAHPVLLHGCVGRARHLASPLFPAASDSSVPACALSNIPAPLAAIPQRTARRRPGFRSAATCSADKCRAHVTSNSAIGRQNLSHWFQILLWSTELRVNPEDDQAS